MKTALISLSLIAAFVFSASAQIRVVSKKVTYTRPHPISTYKKFFTIERPIVTAANRTISRRIENALNYERIFGFTLREELSDIQWLEEASFEVLYNKNNILCVGLYIEGTAAYPSGESRYIVIDVRDGSVATPAKVFVKRGELTALVRRRQQAAMETAAKEWKTDPDSADLDGNELFEGKTFSEADLKNFSVTPEGVTFRYEFGFPHAILAAEPESEYLFTWKEVGPFIDPNGLLAAATR